MERSRKQDLRIGRILSLSVALTAALAIDGCSRPFYKAFPLDTSPPTSLSLDARQRVVLVTDQGGPQGDRRVVCAEPSPDVFAAAAISAGLDAKVGPDTIGGSLTSAESAGALAFRSQTIQLLRDGLYRACEAYLNGVIKADEYGRIIAAYDEMLITLLAVEGLTQHASSALPTVKAHAATGPSGSGSDTPAVPAPATDSALPEARVAEQVHYIVRDYYCFQLGLKEFFYPRLGAVNTAVRSQLCGGHPPIPAQ